MNFTSLVTNVCSNCIYTKTFYLLDTNRISCPWTYITYTNNRYAETARIIKPPEHFHLTRRTQPAGKARCLVTPGIRNKAHRPLNMCYAVWAPTELHGHQRSGVNVHRSSDSRKRLLVQLCPPRAPEANVGVSKFGWWKELRWDPWLVSLLESCWAHCAMDSYLIKMPWVWSSNAQTAFAFWGKVSFVHRLSGCRCFPWARNSQRVGK